ncbi:hypothetical protein [Megasphaera elsdenii]|uniref:hypothetical protein n=1 Tax=Megasphaera elsdenii TaxID=907 RepID=UPI0012D79468|nr:hypothetical protein [Megasphaera elsdenii]
MADSNAAGYTDDNGKYIPAGIVLGEYSYSNTRAGKDGYLKPSTASTDAYWNAVWRATANPMAIGDADTDANGNGQGKNGHGILTRQITGVAAGTVSRITSFTFCARTSFTLYASTSFTNFFLLKL